MLGKPLRERWGGWTGDGGAVVAAQPEPRILKVTAPPNVGQASAAKLGGSDGGGEKVFRRAGQGRASPPR